MAKVSIVMGSDSDMPVMAQAADFLEEMGIDFETVSYTHLDVYKRQSWTCAGKRTADCSSL